MKVSFDGQWYDVDTEEDKLRLAIYVNAKRRVAQVPHGHRTDALIELFSSATLIAVKFGATAAMHHAYAQPVDYELVDTYAHVINRLVGLNYTPPDQVTTTEETDSGSTEHPAG